MESTGVLAGYRRALAGRDFRLLVVAFIVDQAASWAYSIVFTAYVFERSHSVGWLTAIAIAGFLTGVLMSGPAGVVADRYDRRAVLLCSAVIAAVVSAGVGAAFVVNAPLWILLILRVLLSAATSPTRACSGALLPEVVSERDLVAGNGLFGILESLVVVLGPAIGGLVTLLGKPVDGVWINVASFVIAAVIYLRLNVRSRGGGEAGGNVVSEWINGVSALASHKAAIALVLFMLLDSFAANAAILLNAPLSTHVGGGSSGIGLLTAAGAIGGVLCAPLATKLASAPKLSTVVYLCIVLQCVPIFFCYIAPNVYVAGLFEVVSGAGMTIVDVLAFTALQRDLPRDILGRALGTVDGLLLLTVVIADALTNVLYNTGGLGVALAVLAFALPVVGLLGLPGLRAGDRASAQHVADLAGRIELLSKLDIFDGATRAILESLAGSATPRELDAGEVIITQGETADALWILEAGQLAVSYSLDGIERPLPDVHAPGYVGELGIIHGAPRSATVTTATPCRLLRIEASDFSAALQSAPMSASATALAGARVSRTSPNAAGRVTVPTA